MPRETRSSARLAAAAAAPRVPNINRNVRVPRLNAAAVAARAAAAEAAAAQAAAAAEAAAAAALENRILALGTLRERQRAASKRYYNSHKREVSERRAAKYAETVGPLRKQVPPPPRARDVVVPQQQQQQEEFQMDDGDNHFDPGQDQEEEPIVAAPRPGKKDPITFAFIEKWLTDNVHVIGTRTTYINNIKNVYRMGNCGDDLRKCINNHKKLISEIDNGTQKNSNQPYDVNSTLGQYQIILFLFDHKNPTCPGMDSISVATQKFYRDKFKQFKTRSVMKQKEKIADPTFAVYPYDVYQKKIGEAFGVDSKEYLIAKLYDEIPARDNFSNLTTVEHSKKGADNENYLVMPGKKAAERARIVINKFKTSAGGKYPPVNVVLSKSLDSILRKYITATNVKVGAQLFGKQSVSKIVKEMNKALDIPANLQNINYIRHSIVSTVHARGDHAQMAKLADDMKHSIMMAFDYVRPLIR